MCIILIEFGIPMKQIRLIKVGRHLSDVFPIENDLKQGDAFLPMLFNFALEYAISRI
jgi:hypothetical protein